MNWKSISTPKGNLKYRLPDIAEGYEFLAVVDNLQSVGDLIRAKGKFVRMLQPYLDYSECGYASFEELLNDRENMAVAIAGIANEIYDAIVGAFSKKN